MDRGCQLTNAHNFVTERKTSGMSSWPAWRRPRDHSLAGEHRGRDCRQEAGPSGRPDRVMMTRFPSRSRFSGPPALPASPSDPTTWARRRRTRGRHPGGPRGGRRRGSCARRHTAPPRPSALPSRPRPWRISSHSARTLAAACRGTGKPKSGQVGPSSAGSAARSAGFWQERCHCLAHCFRCRLHTSGRLSVGGITTVACEPGAISS